MKARLIILGVFVVVFGAVVAVAIYRARERATSSQPSILRPPAVAVRELEERPFPIYEKFYGFIEPSAEIRMQFGVDGEIGRFGTKEVPDIDERTGVARLDPVTRQERMKRVPLEVGDVVEAGTLLMALKLAEKQQEDRVAAAEMAEQEARLIWEAANKAVDRFQAIVDDAKLDAEKAKKLYEDDGVITQREYQGAVNALRRAEADLAGAKAQASSAKQDYLGAGRAAAVQRRELEKTRVYAPGGQPPEIAPDGDPAVVMPKRRFRIAEIPVEIGDRVAPGRTVIRLIEDTAVTLVMRVPQTKILMVRDLAEEDRTVEVLIDALDRHRARDRRTPRLGRITQMPPASNAQSNMFHVEVTIPNPDGAILPGLIGCAIVRGEPITAVAVPVEAAQLVGDTVWVYMIKEGHEVDISTGRLSSAPPVDLPQTWVARKTGLERLRSIKGYYLVRKPPDGLTQLVVPYLENLENGQPVRLLRDKSQDGPQSEEKADRDNPARTLLGGGV